MCRTTLPNQHTQALRYALGQFATGVTVVTATGEHGQSVGITINSFASVSLTPPLVSWCIARRARRYRVFAQARRFCISVLGYEQEDIARRFAASNSIHIEGRTEKAAPPAIAGASAHFQCETMHRFLLGDHLMLIGQITDFECQPGSPLIFAQGEFRAPAVSLVPAMAA